MENLKKEFTAKYISIGKDRFYRFLLSSAIFKMVSYLENSEKIDKKNYKMPDIELLELHDKFMVFYRRENEENYFEIAKLCRRAAHKVYRALLRQQMTQKNNRFINLVE